MRRGIIGLVLAVLAAGALARGGGEGTPLIADPALRARVENRLAEQRALAARREKALFGVLRGSLTSEERDALEYLFAFMPLSDLADYDGEHYLRIVRASLRARREMPWGPKVPADLYLRYVLPHRVNTENLDDARPVFFAELKGRVKGLSLADAVLEVNHWCHEHVTYKASDARTSGPLATIRTSWGRCGEESTVVVAALRAVGIPARQVYTARWAHVDDNHAWVEAWVDGRWRYVGACEPEPALDMGWFREPARRAMIVHTKAMGGSDGPGDKIRSTPWFDEINVLPAYAPASKRTVRVVDARGKPVEGATVEFGLYNYAEFYPLAKLLTGADGAASFVTGHGDLRIWARKGEAVAYRKLPSSEAETTVALGPFDPSERVEDLDVSPPEEPPLDPVPVSAEARAENERRLAEENRIRDAYMATFTTEARAAELARELRLDAGQLWPLLHKSQGNWRSVEDLLRGVPGKRRPWAVKLLGTLSDKDLRDTPSAVLRDHLDRGLPGKRNGADSDLFVSYVLAPRIAHELIRPWRGYLQREFGRAFLARVRRDPREAAAWIRANVRLEEDANYYGVPLTPRGVHELRAADRLSRDVFFVALCRAAGVPARLEPATLRPQFHSGGGWSDVAWNGEPRENAPTARLALTRNAGEGASPEYPVHFALARFENGRYETLDFEGRPWSFFEAPFDLPSGDYVLTTGHRQGDGSVLVRQHFFPLRAGEARVVPLEIRKPEERPPVLGRLDLGSDLAALDTGRALDLLGLSEGKGLVLAWIGRGDEPSTHLLGDLSRLRPAMEAWGGGLVIALTARPAEGVSTIPSDASLAAQTVVALDDGGALLRNALDALGRSGPFRLPVILGVTPSGEVIFFSEGYRIGAGEQALESFRRLERARR